MPDISAKKILLVDDEADILHLLETVLKKEGFIHIYKAFNGRESIELCRREQPDIIVLDIMLPDMNGFEVCQILRDMTVAPILFLSAKSEDMDKILGLGLGGDDYITKPFSPKEVAYRIKAYFRRHQYFHKKDEMPVYSFGDIEVDEKRAEVRKSGKLVSLTAKEYQLLLFLARHPNQIFSKSKLYEAVWGEEYFGYDNTIMVHIRHLREKLEDNPSAPVYVLTIRGLGYKLRDGSAGL
ncbi:response regulator transcription factor [Aneurinibacillus aneurinilyticus]|uniref:Response regulator transcription factor n=2 Tax=Aneurinibacillus aneurinilyticus TaxID=1391 RepID=A0A848CY61_ANEAE|nr:response regulator transcription factor [Aneurinibacillus aneurinilyticus]MCI1696360.1 response regulator transcription factor [Aneurinibacillus aneurinilyticus]MED0708419.1 response regulator transcription factor [Aneurinibacillus aneurinilyticus]MED0722514.1 response regulator transcription factor [Aneurinibacillus aneurinilyticus]MED0732447.1 response regulator transcription factor [Aneurinibacillus aneurinilyticus]MED0741936.1 response regulator transcription factor [Aneurinibacillus an